MRELYEERLQRLEYYQQLLVEVMQEKDYPFYQLVIEKGLTQEEVSGVFHLCDKLNKKYEEQKRLGFVHYYPLLIQFAGMLNVKLHPDDTIFALHKQKLYTKLMEELQHIRVSYKI